MKIGFFGNTNNYPFMLALALRRLGHEVEFIVERSEPLHRPEFKYHDIPYPYPKWVHDLSVVRSRDLAYASRKRMNILRILRGCDAVILNGLGPSLSADVNRPAFVLLTGGDLDHFGDPKNIDYLINTYFRNSNALSSYLLRPLLRPMIQRLIGMQRTGIRGAVAVSYFARGLVQAGDRVLDDIGVADNRRAFILMTDVETIRNAPHLHKNMPVRIFCLARLNWKRPIPIGMIELDYKGSDIMIRGLGGFVRKTGIPLDIRLVRKGVHVRETERLVLEEGLASCVTWLDEMSPLDVLAEYRAADIIFDQLDNSIVGLGGLDAMATGRPLIANARPEITDRYVREPSPVCQARTPEEVCMQLERLVPDPQERERVGRLSRKYVERFFSSERAAQIVLDKLGAA